MNEGPLPSVSTNNECAERSRRMSALWPWIVFLLFTFLFDASIAAVLASDFFIWCRAQGIVYPVVALFCGAICGQWLLVMAICGPLGRLVLRDTAITDASLALLAESNLHTIDLCDTQVSAAGIAKQDWEFKELKVTAAQFSEAEFKLLLPLATFKIEAPTPSKRRTSSRN
jgi:hypothetical protein